jgi:hypothetical protein
MAAVGAVAGATIGAVSTSVQQAIDVGRVDAQQVGIRAGIGAAVGAVTGAFGYKLTSAKLQAVERALDLQASKIGVLSAAQGSEGYKRWFFDNFVNKPVPIAWENAMRRTMINFPFDFGESPGDAAYTSYRLVYSSLGMVTRRAATGLATSGWFVGTGLAGASYGTSMLVPGTTMGGSLQPESTGSSVGTIDPGSAAGDLLDEELGG